MRRHLRRHPHTFSLGLAHQVDTGRRTDVGDVDMGSIAGGVPTETVWQADVQSGLYFARFTAKATDGTRATKLIKMAVIR